MVYREPETGPWLQVDSFGVELPGGVVTGTTLVDVAANGSLWNRHNAKVSLKARQGTKWMDVDHAEQCLASSSTPLMVVNVLHQMTNCVELWVW